MRQPVQYLRLTTALVHIMISCAQSRRVEIGDLIDEDYDFLYPPLENGQPVSVFVRLVLLKIRDMDVSDMTYTADVIHSRFWKDKRLQYPKWMNKSPIIINQEWSSKIWLPRLAFKNSVKERTEQGLVPVFYLKLYNDSTLHYKTRASIDFVCEMDLRNYPHDTQTCGIVILSEIHTIDEVVVYWHKKEAFRGSVHLILPQFEITNITVVDCCNFTYDYGTFSCVKGSIHLQRLVGFYIINIYIPTILIVAMSMLTFWIPPDAVPARVTLGVTSLLTMITKQYGASMPKVSYVVALNVWLSSCIAFVFIGLLEYAVVIAIENFQRYQTSSRDESPRSSSSSKVTPRPAFNALPKDRKSLSCPLESCLSFSPVRIDYVSRLMFPLFFVSYCSIYYAIYAT